METLPGMQAYVFGSLFQLANKLQVIGDRYVEKEGLTTKQWFLMVAVQQFSDEAPTLSEVAALMGSSRQNIKQLALKLENRGFLRIEKDKRDTRAFRLLLTDKCISFWENRQDRDTAFIMRVFRGLTEKEIDTVSSCFKKLLRSIDEGGVWDE